MCVHVYLVHITLDPTQKAGNEAMYMYMFVHVGWGVGVR